MKMNWTWNETFYQPNRTCFVCASISQLFTQSLYTAAGLVCSMGNLLVALVIIRNVKLHGKIFLFLVNLSIGDIFKGLGYLTLGSKRLHLITTGLDRSVSSFDCMREFPTTMLILGPQSINLMTVLVSLDRFIAIAFPLYYSRLTKKYVYACIAACWTFVSISYIFAWMGSSGLPRTGQYSAWCVVAWSFTSDYNRFMFGFEAMSTWVTSLLLMATLFVIKFPPNANIATINRPSYYKRQLKVAKMVLICLSFVVILWVVPTNIVFVMTMMGRTKIFDVYLAPILWTMVAFSGCTNIFVYAWLNRKIKAGIKEVILQCGRKPQKPFRCGKRRVENGQKTRNRNRANNSDELRSFTMKSTPATASASGKSSSNFQSL